MNDKYIKMVLALPAEFFADWIWTAGNRAILLDDHYKREVMIMNTTPQICIKNLKSAELLFPYSLNADKIEEAFERLRPLPTQKQLQEKSTLDWWTFYSSIVHRSDIKYNDRDESCECACLRQCVWVLYGKKWNGEKWE